MQKPLLLSLFSAWAARVSAAPAPTPAYLAEELGQIGSGAAGQGAATPSLLPTLLNVVFSLALVLGLVYLLYWLLLKWRERQGLASAGKLGLIKVLERQSLDASHSLAVVELGGEIFYLGLGRDISL